MSLPRRRMRPSYSGAIEPVCEYGPGRKRGTTPCRPCRFGREHEKEFLHIAASLASGTKERPMDVVHRCCCGVDVHKETVTACVARAELTGRKRHEKRQFGTATRELLALADWLRD